MAGLVLEYPHEVDLASRVWQFNGVARRELFDVDALGGLRDLRKCADVLSMDGLSEWASAWIHVLEAQVWHRHASRGDSPYLAATIHRVAEASINNSLI